MTTGPPSRPPRRASAPDGPLVGVCVGQRCAALRKLRGGSDPLPEAVRATPGAVLVHTACPGPCALAAVAAVARRDGASGRAGPALWLAGVEAADRSSALAVWITKGGPAPGPDPTLDLPSDLRAALVPSRAARRTDRPRRS